MKGKIDRQSYMVIVISIVADEISRISSKIFALHIYAEIRCEVEWREVSKSREKEWRSLI